MDHSRRRRTQERKGRDTSRNASRFVGNSLDHKTGNAYQQHNGYQAERRMPQEQHRSNLYAHRKQRGQMKGRDSSVSGGRGGLPNCHCPTSREVSLSLRLDVVSRGGNGDLAKGASATNACSVWGCGACERPHNSLLSDAERCSGPVVCLRGEPKAGGIFPRKRGFWQVGGLINQIFSEPILCVLPLFPVRFCGLRVVVCWCFRFGGDRKGEIPF